MNDVVLSYVNSISCPTAIFTVKFEKESEKQVAEELKLKFNKMMLDY